MSRPRVNFFSEDLAFTLKRKIKVRDWICRSVNEEGRKLKELNFIFCSDSYLLKLNKEYLNHNTYTDVITFDNSEEPREIQGDIFISIERIAENAGQYHVSESDELHRVLIHGVLHLAGYTDKTRESKTIMTAKEDYYLKQREF